MPRSLEIHKYSADFFFQKIAKNYTKCEGFVIKYYRMYCRLARAVPKAAETLSEGLLNRPDNPAKTTAYHDVMHS